MKRERKLKDDVPMFMGKRVFLGIGFVLMLCVLVPAFLLRDSDGQSEQQRCNDYCQQEYDLKGVLVPIVTNQRTKKNDYAGPWKCTCPR